MPANQFSTYQPVIAINASHMKGRNLISMISRVKMRPTNGYGYVTKRPPPHQKARAGPWLPCLGKEERMFRLEME